MGLLRRLLVQDPMSVSKALLHETLSLEKTISVDCCRMY